MRLNIKHISHYSYSKSVAYALQQVRQTPKPRPSQDVIDWRIDLSNAQQEVEFEDQFNNQTLLIRADENTADIKITCRGVVETHNKSG
ncbi:MAG: transglutaminase N-terminal domain-containing protein, partial [Pseudomonadota bacterium]